MTAAFPVAEIPSGKTSPPRSIGPIVQVALVDIGGSPPEIVRQLTQAHDRCICTPTDITTEDRPAAFRRFDVAVMVDRGGGRTETGRVDAGQEERLRRLEQFGLGAIVFTDRSWAFATHGPGVVSLPSDASLDLVYGALLSMARSRPVLRQIDRQVVNLTRLGETLRRQMEETDHELQLASRLQHDFLPKDLHDAGLLHFETVYRPCTWVSGDIFDIFRLDERHFGFYLADAVGHGVAAGLLTMYIKHAIRPKRIYEHSYELVRPSEVLSMLNDQLAMQGLPDSQFITLWYGLLNFETLELTYASAGHPPPWRVAADGTMQQLTHEDGCPLGLQAGEGFSDERFPLCRGDRLIVYSDGLEESLIAERRPMPDLPTFRSGVAELLRLPGPALIQRLHERLDNEPGSLRRADDVTMVLVDVAPASG